MVLVAEVGGEDHEEDCEGVLVRMCVSWLEWEICLVGRDLVMKLRWG